MSRITQISFTKAHVYLLVIEFDKCTPFHSIRGWSLQTISLSRASIGSISGMNFVHILQNLGTPPRSARQSLHTLRFVFKCCWISSDIKRVPVLKSPNFHRVIQNSKRSWTYLQSPKTPLDRQVKHRRSCAWISELKITVNITKGRRIFWK